MADPQQLSIDQFAASVKAKYPVYNHIDNLALTQATLDKYPIYKGMLSQDALTRLAAQVPPQEAPKPVPPGPKGFDEQHPYLAKAADFLTATEKPSQITAQAFEQQIPKMLPQDMQFAAKHPKLAPPLQATNQFVYGVARDAAEKLSIVASDPKNLPFIASGAGAGMIRPLVSKAAAGLFSALNAYGAFDAAKRGDWQNAGVQAAFTLLGIHETVSPKLKTALVKEASKQGYAVAPIAADRIPDVAVPKGPELQKGPKIPKAPEVGKPIEIPSAPQVPSAAPIPSAAEVPKPITPTAAPEPDIKPLRQAQTAFDQLHKDIVRSEQIHRERAKLEQVTMPQKALADLRKQAAQARIERDNVLRPSETVVDEFGKSKEVPTEEFKAADEKVRALMAKQEAAERAATKLSQLKGQAAFRPEDIKGAKQRLTAAANNIIQAQRDYIQRLPAEKRAAELTRLDNEAAVARKKLVDLDNQINQTAPQIETKEGKLVTPEELVRNKIAEAQTPAERQALHIKIGDKMETQYHLVKPSLVMKRVPIDPTDPNAGMTWAPRSEKEGSLARRVADAEKEVKTLLADPKTPPEVRAKLEKLMEPKPIRTKQGVIPAEEAGHRPFVKTTGYAGKGEEAPTKAAQQRILGKKIAKKLDVTQLERERDVAERDLKFKSAMANESKKALGLKPERTTLPKPKPPIEVSEAPKPRPSVKGLKTISPEVAKVAAKSEAFKHRLSQMSAEELRDLEETHLAADNKEIAQRIREELASRKPSEVEEDAADKWIREHEGEKGGLSFLGTRAIADQYSTFSNLVSRHLNTGITLSDSAIGVMRHYMARQARWFDQLNEKFHQSELRFAKLTKEQAIDFIDKYEKGLLRGVTSEDGLLYKALHDETDKIHQEIEALPGDLKLGYIEDYFKHLWQVAGKKGPNIEQLLNKAITRRGSIEGARGFLKQRTIQYFKEGIEQYNLVPRTWNPIKLQLYGLMEAGRFKMAHEMFNTLKEMGAARFARNFREVKPDWIKFDDRIATVRHFSDKERGMVHRGDYYGPKEAVDFFNNTFNSPSWYAKSGWPGILARGYGFVANTMLSIKLGFSFFHGMFETVNAITTEGMHAMQDALYGDWRAAGTHFLKWATGPTVTVSDWLRTGSKMQAAWLGKTEYHVFPWEKMKPVEAQFQTAAKLMEMGGGRWRTLRPNVEERFQRPITEITNSLRSKGLKVFTDGHFGSLAADVGSAMKNAIPALTHWASKPLMQEYVPRIKMAAFYNSISDILRRSGPDYNLSKIHAETQRVWRMIDNAHGQVVYDNYGWSRQTKEILQWTFQSLGWNFGSFNLFFRDMGKDVTKFVAKAVSSGAPTNPAYFKALRDYVTPNMLYVVSTAATTAYIGSLATKLLTGNWPTNFKDMVHPPNGRYDSQGRPQHMNIPGYFKDMERAYIDLLGANVPDMVQMLDDKLNPVIHTANDLWRNSTFQHTQIYDPTSSVADHVKSISLYLATHQMTPYNFGNAYQQYVLGTPPRELILTGLGLLTPAPARTNMKPVELYMNTILSGRGGSMIRTQQQADKAQRQMELQTKYLSGDIKDYSSLVHEAYNPPKGKPQLSEAQIEHIDAIKTDGPTVAAFKKLDLHSAVDVFERFPENRHELLDAFNDKLDSVDLDSADAQALADYDKGDKLANEFQAEQAKPKPIPFPAKKGLF